MSFVTNVILTSNYVPDSSGVANVVVTGHGDRTSRFAPLDIGAVGGSKCWEADTWMGAFNYLHRPIVDRFGRLFEIPGWMDDLAGALEGAHPALLIFHREDDEPEDLPMVLVLRGHRWFVLGSQSAV